MKIIYLYNLLIFLWVFQSFSFAQYNKSPNKLAGLDVLDTRSNKVNLNYTFLNSQGEKVKFKDYFVSNKALVLSFAYFNCNKMCNFLLNQLSKNLKKSEVIPGSDYFVLTISIDTNDNYEEAKKYQEEYRKNIKRNDIVEPSFWSFLVSPDNQVKKLADEIGFLYTYDSELDQYIHGASLYVLQSDGTVGQIMKGIYKPLDLKIAVNKAIQKKVSIINVSQFLPYCYTLISQNINIARAWLFIRIVTVITIMWLFVFIFKMFQKERIKKRQQIG